ncbi:hypothetical protein K1719_004014 [Acacia pycnantha]|nr:hypothetical protein K1719_004014 [Acacia pycnantha]
MIRWAIELSEFDISYESRHAFKSQALADFIMELTPPSEGEVEDAETWKVFVDGSSNTKGSGAEIIVESPEGISIEHSFRLNFPTSNNQAEYEALLAGLLQAKENGAKKVHRKPIIDYLERGVFLEDSTEAKKLVREAALYMMVDDQLYRKGLHSPMLRCLNSEEAKYVLAEIHEGINGQDMGTKALAWKSLRAGYY